MGSEIPFLLFSTNEVNWQKCPIFMRELLIRITFLILKYVSARRSRSHTKLPNAHVWNPLMRWGVMFFRNCLVFLNLLHS